MLLSARSMRRVVESCDLGWNRRHRLRVAPRRLNLRVSLLHFGEERIEVKRRRLVAAVCAGCVRGGGSSEESSEHGGCQGGRGSSHHWFGLSQAHVRRRSSEEYGCDERS
jgi:hypothetical protein